MRNIAHSERGMVKAARHESARITPGKLQTEKGIRIGSSQ